MAINKISDEDLLLELKGRFEEQKKAIEAQEILMAQLSAVNRKLLASEQLKSNFLSNIRNEINNPITATLELSRQIANGNLDAQKVLKFASLIYNETFSLNFQLRNIFLSAELEAGESKLLVISVNPSSILEGIIESFQHEIDKKGIVLVLKNSIDKEQNFYTDSEKLYAIISNLISNAIKYSSAGGSIEICSKTKHNQLVISIQDHGIGISKENVTLIFDRFRQVDEGSSKFYAGEGLGLSVTKTLLEMLNGHLELTTELGKGSTFTISINELEPMDNDDSTFSSDGNDFLFMDQEAFLF